MKVVSYNPARLVPWRSVSSTLLVSLGVLLVASFLWQLRQGASPLSLPSYQAPALELMTSGAIPMQLTLSDLRSAFFSPSSFHIIVEDAPLPFALEFEGVKTQETRIYDLSSGTYPLTLTLLGAGQGYHQFKATAGTVELAGGEGIVSAFLSDEQGQQLFLSARINWPDGT